LSDIVNIDVFETIEEVTINATPNVIEVNINRISGGGGGSQTLEQTLDLGNNTGGNDILLNNADSLLLENTSSLKKGTYDFGGNGGVSRICSNNYEDMWQNGFRHVFDQSGFIRNSTNCFDVIPDNTFDVTLRFKVGSIWTLDDGTNYICTDATEGFAVWAIYNEIPSTLGLIRIEDIYSGGELFTDLSTGIAYLQNYTNATITDASFDEGVLFFTVPRNSSFDLTDSFLSGTSANFYDELGLISTFGDYAFNSCYGNIVLGDVTFGADCISGDSNIEVGTINTFGTNFCNNFLGKLIIKKSLPYYSDATFFFNSTGTLEIPLAIIDNPLIPIARVNGANISLDGFDKVDKITGKGLSTNDYTDTEKTKLAGIAEGATNVTKTSDLINDGDNGISHFISLEDLPSNIIFYPTNAASDVGGYVKIVTSITDPSYNTTAVDISTGAITTTDQLISSLATSANIIVGNPGVFNITTIGNIRRISGTGQASFYFKVYKRTSAGVETLIATSDNTIPVIDSGVYTEFTATAIWNDGVFLDTDRVVMKYYANRISGGSNPTYQFQFGGVTPVRTLVPIPLTVVPLLPIDEPSTDGRTNAVSSNAVFDALVSKEDATNKQNSLALDGTGVKFPTVDAVNNLSWLDKMKREVQFFTDFNNLASNITGLQANNSGAGATSTLATNTIPNRHANQVGFCQYQTGTTLSGFSFHQTQAGFLTFSLGGGLWNYETSILISDLSTITDRFRFLSGFASSSFSNAEADGVFFTYDEGGVQNGTSASPNWQCVTVANSNRTVTNTTVAVNLLWNTLRIEINAEGTSVVFKINGTTVATHTNNIPLFSNNRFVQVKQGIAKSIGITSRSVFCDYLGYENYLTTPR